MTPREKQIATLYSKGLDVEAIARKIGVSRTYVYARMDKLELCPPRFKDDEEDSRKTIVVTDANTSWCRGCGANVTKPCVLCRTRKAQKVKSGGSRGPASHDGRVVRQVIGRV